MSGNRKGCPYVPLPGSKERMPTLTTVVGSFLGALAAGVGQEIAADLLKEHTINRWLDSRINHDVQQALRRAFARAVEDLLKEYQASRPWEGLSPEQQTLVRERCALLQSPEIIAQLFPTVDDPRGELPNEDSGKTRRVPGQRGPAEESPALPRLLAGIVRNYQSYRVHFLPPRVTLLPAPA